MVARGDMPTVALRLRGNGSSCEITGGFVLLPRCEGGGSSGGGVSGGMGGANIDVGATPTRPGDGIGMGNETPTSHGGAAAASSSRATAAATLSMNSCLPPYTRFLDYWDGAEETTGGGASAAASLVCVAAGGSRVSSDRVLAMKISGGGGEGSTVRMSKTESPLLLVLH